MNDPLLRAEHLGKTYPDGKVQALVDVSVAIERGEYVAIMGASGSGKSLWQIDAPQSPGCARSAHQR
jgi:ABC-type phosphate/phosphonate transport system ATPase subunit